MKALDGVSCIELKNRRFSVYTENSDGAPIVLMIGGDQQVVIDRAYLPSLIAVLQVMEGLLGQNCHMVTNEITLTYADDKTEGDDE